MNVVFGRPANSGWVGSVPVSTIVSGTPGPGGVARSAPTSASHHSCAWRGSVAPRTVAAVAELAAAPGVEVVGVSTLVDTEPMGLLDQPRFLNGALVLETELPARALLDLLLAVEAR